MVLFIKALARSEHVLQEFEFEDELLELESFLEFDELPELLEPELLEDELVEPELLDDFD